MMLESLVKVVWDFYTEHGRHDLLWRKSITPYKIVVSEIMLQQTQVDRVTPKFRAFLKAFPNFKKLAQASQVDVLRLWKGLGYNSRALRLQSLSQEVTSNYNGRLPRDRKTLESLPGVGPYTAGAILAFVYDQPVSLIETNVRRVYLHHIFEGVDTVSDKEVLEKVNKTLPVIQNKKISPRQWYWALMDYGAHLGRTLGKEKKNPNSRSQHYTKQSKFLGSDRQIRGKILAILLEQEKLTRFELFEAIKGLTKDKQRMSKIIARLEKENFLESKGDILQLKK